MGYERMGWVGVGDKGVGSIIAGWVGYEGVGWVMKGWGGS